MKKNFYATVMGLFLLGWLGCVSTSYAADGDPIALLQSIADRMIDNLRSHKASLKTNPSVVYSIANKIVVPHADLDVMSQRVLPPAVWNSATPAQRREFKSEFTNILVRTYASALEDYTDETVRFFPVRGGIGGKSSITVNSQIVRSDGPSISVNYQMVRSGSQWKLYDLIVEGVSMLESFRSQFGDVLSQGNMADLLRKLSSHNRKNERGQS